MTSTSGITLKLQFQTLGIPWIFERCWYKSLIGSNNSKLPRSTVVPVWGITRQEGVQNTRSWVRPLTVRRKEKVSYMIMAPPLASLISSESGRVLSIQSHTVQGYVGNKSAVFPLQLLGFDVDPINSVQFSNHTGYPTWKGQVLDGEQLWSLIEGLEANNLLFYTHLLTGYIGSLSFLETILEVVHKLRSVNPNLLYVCDPVMGDEGKLYIKPELVPLYKDKVVPLASMLTPNQFEAELLTGCSIHSEADALEACKKLHGAGPSKVVITSLDINSDLLLIGSHLENEEDAPKQFLISMPKIPAYFTRQFCNKDGYGWRGPIDKVLKGLAIINNFGASNMIQVCRIGSTSCRILQSLIIPLAGNSWTASIRDPIDPIGGAISRINDGTGDLMAALLLGWSYKYPNSLETAAELAVASLQAVLERTLLDYNAAKVQPEVKQLELRLIQSQEQIKHPIVEFHAKRFY